MKRSRVKPNSRRLADSPRAAVSPARPPTVLDLAGVHEPLEERPGGDDDGPGPVGRPAPTSEAGDPPLVDDQGLDHLLAEGQALLTLDGQLGQGLVCLLVGLDPGAVHGGAFAPVEQAELEARRVGEDPHRPAQGVDLSDDLPLGHAADGRVATHLADGVDVDRQQGRPEAHPARRQGRFQASMPRADDEDVILIGIVPGGGHGFPTGSKGSRPGLGCPRGRPAGSLDSILSSREVGAEDGPVGAGGFRNLPGKFRPPPGPGAL